MPTIKQLQEQGIALAEDQKALVLDESRPWSAKKSQFEALDADIKAVFQQYSALKAVETGQYADLGGGNATWTNAAGRGRKALGGLVDPDLEQIAPPTLNVTTEQAHQLYEAATHKAAYSISTTDFKNATDSTSIPQSVIPQYQTAPLTALREPTRVLDLIPTMAIGGPVITWYTTTGTAAAAAVAEGGTKPTSTISYNAVTGTVTKIAHVAEVTDETLADFPSFMGVLQADMVAGVISAENAELLTATVTGAHKFAGLLNTSGILTRARSTDTNLDAISKAFNDLRTGTTFFEPDGIIMHPTNWQTIRLSKDSNGQYYLNPYESAANGVGNDLRLWGLPVVLSTQMTLNTALVGAFQQSTRAYVRDGIRVETNQYGTTQFTNNTTMVRAEERLLLTVPRPTGLVAVTGLN